MWKATAGGRRLHFRLTGINNQNFIMRDEETGSWWQQITGCAFEGPLQGTCLEAIAWDEVTFEVFRREHPEARVLLPVDKFKDEYAGRDWETEIAEYPPGRPDDPADPLRPRDLVVGVAAGGGARAYSWKALGPAQPVADTVGDVPILIVLNPDGKSLRCFDRRLADGRTLEGFTATRTCPPVVHDAGGSAWDFGGVATAGPLQGRTLARIPCLKDYWFDWKTYNPATTVFTTPASARTESRPCSRRRGRRRGRAARTGWRRPR